MRQLFGARTGNCFRAAIALEEAGLPYEVRQVDLTQGEHRDANFLALNFRGKVPALVLSHPGDQPFVLTQSNAIMLYAAEQVPGQLLPAAQERDHRARALERFLYFITDVIAPSHAAFALRGLSSAQEGAALLNARCLDALVATERFLEEGPFIAGDRFTLADICAYTIATASKESMDWDALPRTRKWFDRIAVREATQRGMSAF